MFSAIGRYSFWVFLPLFFLFYVAGCPPSAEKREIGRLPLITSDDPRAETEFREAKLLLDRGAITEAANRFEAFIAGRMNDPLVPIAQLSLGRIRLSQNRLDEARSLFKKVIAHPDAAVAEQGRFYYGVAAHLQGDHRTALEILEPMRGRTIDPADTVLLLRTIAAASAQLGDFVKALTVLDTLSREAVSESDRVEARTEAAEISAKRASPEEIERAYREVERGGKIWTSIAKRALKDADQIGDVDRISQIIEALRDEEVKFDPEMEEIAIRAARPTDANPQAVGAILSLSGRARELGEQALRGLMLAAGLPPTSPLPPNAAQVIFRDDKADPERAVQAVNELVFVHRVVAIVGPIDAQTSLAAAKRSQELGVPIITLTPAGQVTEVGPMVFRLFPTPESEIKKLIEFATVKKREKRFAILYPNNSYGELMRDVFARQAGLAGGQVVATQSYEPKATSFGQEIASLTKKKFDAIFLPDTSREVALIAPALAAADLWSAPEGGTVPNGARAITVLAPSVSFDHQLASTVGRYLQGAVFSSPFDPTTASGKGREFVDRFQAQFGATPNIFAALAYDSYRFIRSAVEHKAAKRVDVANFLNKISDMNTVGPSPGFSLARDPSEATRLLELRDNAFVPLESW
ncbi:MAG: ABC transporter substrate-binding protein [Deltaproteobacteria bacterium]|nr:ABC transporter substrate-binding protein [Deltaproteobacteria bacterium]